MQTICRIALVYFFKYIHVNIKMKPELADQGTNVFYRQQVWFHDACLLSDAAILLDTSMSLEVEGLLLSPAALDQTDSRRHRFVTFGLCFGEDLAIGAHDHGAGNEVVPSLPPALGHVGTEA